MSLSEKGVKVKAGDYIKVDNTGVSVDINAIASKLADLIIPSGTIVPFYGNGKSYDINPPSGWVWCDGNNNTPNLNTNSDFHDSKALINVISGSINNTTNYWQLGNGTHLAANVYLMRYIMKK